jgi:hypothetical protein
MPTRREIVVAMVATCLALETALGTLALIQSVRGQKEQSRNPRDPAEYRPGEAAQRPRHDRDGRALGRPSVRSFLSIGLAQERTAGVGHPDTQRVPLAGPRSSREPGDRNPDHPSASVACSGAIDSAIDARAQAEVHSALRTATPPSALASRRSLGQVGLNVK